MKPDQERVRHLLTQTVGLLCKNGLQFDCRIRIEGVLGITVDDSDVFIVHIDENIAVPEDRIITLPVSNRASSNCKPNAVQSPSLSHSAPLSTSMDDCKNHQRLSSDSNDSSMRDTSLKYPVKIEQSEEEDLVVLGSNGSFNNQYSGSVCFDTKSISEMEPFSNVVPAWPRKRRKVNRKYSVFENSQDSETAETVRSELMTAAQNYNFQWPANDTFASSFPNDQGSAQCGSMYHSPQLSCKSVLSSFNSAALPTIVHEVNRDPIFCQTSNRLNNGELHVSNYLPKLPLHLSLACPGMSKRVVCQYYGCGKTFRHSFHMYRHQRKKHGQRYVP